MGWKLTRAELDRPRVDKLKNQRSHWSSQWLQNGGPAFVYSDCPFLLPIFSFSFFLVNFPLQIFNTRYAIPDPLKWKAGATGESDFLLFRRILPPSSATELSANQRACARGN